MEFLSNFAANILLEFNEWVLISDKTRFFYPWKNLGIRLLKPLMKSEHGLACSKNNNGSPSKRWSRTRDILLGKCLEGLLIQVLKHTHFPQLWLKVTSSLTTTLHRNDWHVNKKNKRWSNQSTMKVRHFQFLREVRVLIVGGAACHPEAEHLQRPGF